MDLRTNHYEEERPSRQTAFCLEGVNAIYVPQDRALVSGK